MPTACSRVLKAPHIDESDWRILVKLKNLLRRLFEYQQEPTFGERRSRLAPERGPAPRPEPRHVGDLRSPELPHDDQK